MPPSPGNTTVVASASVSGATSVGSSSSRPNAARSDSVPRDTCRGTAAQLGALQGERVEDRRLQVLGERHPRPFGEQLAEEVEAGVRVDAPLTGPGDWQVALERKPGGMGEQVAEAGPRGAHGFVQVEDTLLGRDEHRVRGEELRHGGPAEDDVGRASLTGKALPGDYGDRHGPGRPRVDLLQSPHGRRY